MRSCRAPAPPFLLCAIFSTNSFVPDTFFLLFCLACTGTLQQRSMLLHHGMCCQPFLLPLMLLFFCFFFSVCLLPALTGPGCEYQHLATRPAAAIRGARQGESDRDHGLDSLPL